MYVELSNLELKAYTEHIINNIKNGKYISNMNKLYNDFLYAFSNCESEIEISEYKELLLQISQKYNLYIEKWIEKSINVVAYNKIKKFIFEQNKEMYGDNKSSYVAPDKSVIKSAYFIYYRPENKNLSNLCDGFIYKLIGAEFRDTKEKLEDLMNKFYECLSCCENEKDIQQFNAFLIILSKKGKFAKAFYDLNSDKITLNQTNPYKEVDEYDEKVMNNKTQMEIEYFEEKYKKALKKSEDFETKRFYDEFDYDEIIEMYKKLREDLDLIAQFIGKIKYDMISNQIDGYISYYNDLKDMARSV